MMEKAIQAFIEKVHAEAQDSAPVEDKPDAVWEAVRKTGTQLWLDTGDMEEAAKLWNNQFEALTTNNTLLNKEVQKGLYDDLVKRAAETILGAAPDIDQRALLLEIAFILNARHGLALVDRFGAYVSVELHTDLINDVDRTLAYGQRFYAICPRNFIVKVPLSPAGLVATRRLSEAGIPVNFTLGFSARQNVLAALVARPAYVNVFMGRLNAFVSDNKLGDGRNIGEKATLATQRALLALRNAGKTDSRLIGASMRDGTQVASLAGLDVYTMPPKVAAAYRESPQANLQPQVRNELPVTTADGVTFDAFAGNTLWDVSDAFVACAEEIAQIAPDQLTVEGILSRLADGGFGDLFPEWSQDDDATATQDGKIPVYAHWKERLAAGEIGLDSVMNLSAFRSFSEDQAALDRRIEANL